MAAKEFDIPELPTYIEIPDLNAGVMDGEGPFKSSEEFQAPLGFPGDKIDNWQEVAINKMGDLKDKDPILGLAVERITHPNYPY